MYETKIPGTRYSIALENVKGQWMIQIKLDGIIESDIVLKELSDMGILNNIRYVVKAVNLYINDFMVDQIAKELTEQANILFREVPTSATATATVQNAPPPEMSAIEQTLIGIVKRLETLEDRVKKIESTFIQQSE